MALFLSALAYLAISTLAVLALDHIIGRFYESRRRATVGMNGFRPLLSPLIALKSFARRFRS